MTQHRHALTMTAAIAALALGLSACGGSAAENTAGSSTAEPTFAAGTTMAKLSAAGKMTIGTKFDVPLFGLKGLDGKPAGFDVEIAKIIAGELGIAPGDITWVETPSKVREEYLEQGKADLITATYTINDERRKRVTFAGPYYNAGFDPDGQERQQGHHRPAVAQGREPQGVYGHRLRRLREHQAVPR